MIPPPSPIGTGMGAGARTSTVEARRSLKPHDLDVGLEDRGAGGRGWRNRGLGHDRTGVPAGGRLASRPTIAAPALSASTSPTAG